MGKAKKKPKKDAKKGKNAPPGAMSQHLKNTRQVSRNASTRVSLDNLPSDFPDLSVGPEEYVSACLKVIATNQDTIQKSQRNIESMIQTLSNLDITAMVAASKDKNVRDAAYKPAKMVDDDDEYTFDRSRSIQAVSDKQKAQIRAISIASDPNKEVPVNRMSPWNHYVFLKRLNYQAFMTKRETQLFVATMIFLNFMVHVVGAMDINGCCIDNKEAQEYMDYIDMCFAMFFVVELLFMAFAFQMQYIIDYESTFLCFDWGLQWWNWFDIVIIVIPLVMAVWGDGSSVNVVRVLRLTKVFRVLRALRKVEDLYMICMTMVNAFNGMFFWCLLTWIVLSIFSILGIFFFREIMPDEFGNYSRAIATMYYHTFNAGDFVLTFKPIRDRYTHYWVYMMAFDVIAGTMLLNIVITILMINWMDTKDDLENKVQRRSFWTRKDNQVSDMKVKLYEELVHATGGGRSSPAMAQKLYEMAVSIQQSQYNVNTAYELMLKLLNEKRVLLWWAPDLYGKKVDRSVAKMMEPDEELIDWADGAGIELCVIHVGPFGFPADELPVFNIKTDDMPVCALWEDGILNQEWKETRAVELTPQMLEVIISELDRDENMKGFLLRFLFEDALTRAIRAADVNGDGVVDSQEFLLLIREVEARVRNRDLDFGETKWDGEPRIADKHILNVFMECYNAVDNKNVKEPSISNEVMISLISQCQLDVSKDTHLIKLKQLLLKSSGVEEIDDVFKDLMEGNDEALVTQLTAIHASSGSDFDTDPGNSLEMTPTGVSEMTPNVVATSGSFDERNAATV